MTNPVGRPPSGVETKVIAVRIPVELWNRLSRHVDLTTKQGKGAKASINSVVGYAIECLLAAEEKPQQENVKVRQEPQRPSTPAREISTELRQKIENMKPGRRIIFETVLKHPNGISPLHTQAIIKDLEATKSLSEKMPKTLNDTMEKMVRDDGILSRIAPGRYVVAEDVLELLEETEG